MILIIKLILKRLMNFLKMVCYFMTGKCVASEIPLDVKIIQLEQ